MNWDEVAVKVCKDRGLELLSMVSEGGYFFVKNQEGRKFPLTEARLSAWILAEQAKEEAKES